MPAKISKLTLSGFRGATAPASISFDPAKLVTLIFGENGTGKSTIADGFDFVCNRTLGSLENYSLGEPAKNHVASLGSAPAKISVTLESGANKWQATLGKSGPTVTPAAGCPDARILRRRNILSLIEAQPKQRFEALKAFIALPNIEKCENALRDAANSTNGSVDESVRAIVQATAELAKLWTAEGEPGASAVAWATTEMQKDTSQLLANIVQIANLGQGYRDIESALATLDQALSEQRGASQEYAAAQIQQRQAEARTLTQNSKLLSLLRETESYLAERNALSQCPVCEQSVNAQALTQRLRARIGEMQELGSMVALTETAQLQMTARQEVSIRARQDFCQKAGRLATSLGACSLPEVAALKPDWARFAMLLDPALPPNVLEQPAREFWGVIAASLPALEARRVADQKSIHQHNALAGYIETLREKQELAAGQQTLLASLRSALEIVMQQRKDYVEGILASISTEVQSLYEKLHPGEGIGRVKFFLNPKTIGSLEFNAQFQDEIKLPPQAYYSESHLDTLGICVFLALTKYFKTENTVVVLDDVLTSVDAQHLDRFMALLHDQAKHFGQVIVTTHYRPWRDRYRWAKGSVANTQVIELGPWSLQNGLQTGEF